MCPEKIVIKGLIDRTIKLSDPEYKETAIQKARNALKINNFPPRGAEFPLID